MRRRMRQGYFTSLIPLDMRDRKKDVKIQRQKGFLSETERKI